MTRLLVWLDRHPWVIDFLIAAAIGVLIVAYLWDYLWGVS